MTRPRGRPPDRTSPRGRAGGRTAPVRGTASRAVCRDRDPGGRRSGDGGPSDHGPRVLQAPCPHADQGARRVVAGPPLTKRQPVVREVAKDAPGPSERVEGTTWMEPARRFGQEAHDAGVEPAFSHRAYRGRRHGHARRARHAAMSRRFEGTRDRPSISLRSDSDLGGHRGAREAAHGAPGRS